MQDYKYLLEKQLGNEIKEDVKPKKSKKHFIKFILIFVIIAVSLSGIIFFNKTKVFEIKNFEIIGVENSSKKDILKVLKNNKNKPMQEIYSKLIKIKWVDDVILRKQLPDTLVVKVIEKKPESIIELNGKLYIIDKNGEIIDKYADKFYRRDFVIFSFKNVKKYSSVEKEKIAKILDILKNYPFIKDISDITIDKNNLQIILTEPRMKILISMDNLENEIYKINILKRLANTDYIKKSAVAKFDYKDRIYLSRSE